MPEFNDNDLRKLFHIAGRPEPGIDLTDRIMARVAVTPILSPLEVRPLIGRIGWVMIGSFFIGLLIVLFASLGVGTPGASLLGPLLQKLPRFESIRLVIPAGEWTIWAAFAAGTMLLLTLADRALERSVK